ncbi:hypothetical protein XENORESO_008882 [Xenotaenia resolanae]|uniref:Uncharacterized protein n=1 Tax=Xenotaenia resolanae TaxID=208358 RepID=A0ABV0WU76_9TELE
MKRWFEPNDATGNLEFLGSGPTAPQGKERFKPGAVPLMHAGQFTSSMNNAQTLGRCPRPLRNNGLTSLIENRQREELSLNNGRTESSSNFCLFLQPDVAADRCLTCLINRSD